MSDLSEKKLFVLQCSDLLSQNGFRLIETTEKSDFRKETEFGYDEIQLLPAFYGGRSEFGLSFFIRFHEINSIVNKYNSTVPSAHETNPTLGFGLGYFGIDNESLIADSPEQVEKVVKLLKSVVEEKALPFFHKLNSIIALDKEFNRENRPPNLFLHDSFDRPAVGITAAALVKNPKFSFWEIYYKDLVKKTPQNKRDKFDTLVNYLKENILGKG